MKEVKSAKLADGPRTSSRDGKEIMQNIPALNGLLERIRTKHRMSSGQKRESSSNPDLFTQEDIEMIDGDATAGLMYFSRMGKGGFSRMEKDMTKKKMNGGHHHTDATENDDHSVLSETSLERKEAEEAKNQVESLDLGGLLGSENTRSSSFMEPNAKIHKRRKIALSLATLASNPEKILQIVKDGAILAAMELAVIPDIVIQKSCAVIFSLMAAQESIRKAMHTEGAVAVILNLISAPNALVKVECCRALTNLMCEVTDDNTYEQRAVKDGLPYNLVRIVPECPAALDLSLQCLLNLTSVEDRYTRIEEVTDAILNLENKMNLNTSQQIVVAKAVTNLSALKGFQQKLLEDGCMTVVEKAIKRGEGPHRVLAATIVRNLTTCYRTRPKLLDHNIVNLLMSMSRDEVEEVKSLAVKALYLLSRDGSCRERIVAGNAVTVILKISQDTSNIAIGRLAAKTLRVLCGDASVAHTLVGDGIVKVLMTLLKNDDDNIRQYCAESICSLFQIDSIIVRLIDQGAVGVIVNLSKNPSCTTITREWCSFALYYLSTNPACTEETLELGIVPCLVELCSDNAMVQASAHTKYFCSASFAYITLLKDIDSSSGIPVLVQMLHTEDDVMTKNNCISSLYNLADLDENCIAMLDNNCMDPILELTQNDNQDTRIKCAAILCRLSLQEEYYPQFLHSNMMEILLELSSIDHLLTQRRVVIAMSNLSGNADLRAQLFKLKPIPYIVALASKRDENLRRGCVSIVCNLSCKRGTEREIVEAGIVPTLLITAMISSDQLQTKIICCKALINLMADPAMYAPMVKDGIIWGLSNLATQDPYLLQLCCKALACLSYEHAGAMLESSSTMKSAIHLISQNDFDLQRCGGVILLNLLHHPESHVPAFRKYVVKNLRPLAESSDDECNEQAIHILCKLSYFADCTEEIVESGMMKIIDAGSIFNQKSLAVAYLTMFGNISNQESMRTKILNDRTVEKFRQICMSDDSYTDLVVIKTIYSLSCSTENIKRLASDGVIALLEMVWAQEYERPPDLLKYIFAILYNLTTCYDAQGTLVSHGIVYLLMDMWDEARKSDLATQLTAKAIVHLCCGNINTSRAVAEGAPNILTYIVDSQRVNKDGRQGFSYDMAYRVSAAMRNILCVPNNHLPMVQQGCIRALESIAAQSERGKNANDPVTPHTQSNCLAAFKSMTYNSEVRDALTSSGAIDVIVQELLQEDTAITYPLLVQVEAESWSNGARSTTRDGRAKHIEPYPLYTELIETIKVRETAESKKPSADDVGERKHSPRYTASLKRTTSTLAMSFQSELIKRDVKVELE